MSTRTEQLHSQLRDIDGVINRLQQQHARISLSLVETPDDEEIHADLASLEADIAEQQKAATRLRAALREAERRDANDASAEAIAQKRTAGERFLAVMGERVALAKKLDTAWRNALRALDELQGLRESAIQTARAAGVPVEYVHCEVASFEQPMADVLGRSDCRHGMRNFHIDGPIHRPGLSCADVAAEDRDRAAVAVSTWGVTE